MSTKKKNYMVCGFMAVLLIIFFLLSVLLPKREYSDPERRKLAQMPEVTLDSIEKGTFMREFEKFSMDQFPLREEFRHIKAVAERWVFGKKDHHNLYLRDGYLTAIEYPMKEDSITHAADRFRKICEMYLEEGQKAYIAMIPDKNRFAGEKSGYPVMDYERFTDLLKEKTEFAEYIEISDLLSLEDYYRTDTHFRQEKVTDVAETLAEAMGTKLTGQYEIKKATDNFYGVYYGQAALNLPPEPLYYLENDVIRGYKVSDGEHQKEIPVYNMEKAEGKDPYELFLSGPLSLVTIENPAADNDKELILIRDSFGSSVAPLLAEGYRKVTLVDIRYLNPDYLHHFVSFENADLLFLYSTQVLNNSEGIK